MGKRGPAPEPTALKLVKGNPSRRPKDDREPKPRPLFDLPNPPGWMDYHAKSEWKRMGPILIRTGVLTESDLPAFTAYCEVFARWRRAEETLVKHHKETGGYTVGMKRQRHPELITAEKSLAQMLQYMQQFGMTPSARTCIKVERPPDADDFFQ